MSYRFLLINTSNNTLMHDVWFNGQILMMDGTIYEHIKSYVVHLVNTFKAEHKG